MGCGCTGCASRGIVDVAEDNSRIEISEGYSKLATTDWLAEVEHISNGQELVEIRFKNTRKEFFLNKNKINIKKGDVVAVEAQMGHDIGTVSLTGNLVWLQVKKRKIDLERYELKSIYRKAKSSDIAKWKEALELEHPTMIRARQIVEELGLDMKIGDVEFQGDRSKAIFYYIADGRVDFRKLIKVFAEEFRVRIEMKQIGARQEAGRIGGLGSCGRELCCSSWKTNFNTVSLNAAKVQELPPNVQKMAGQCGKLKCCLMYEMDTYLEAREEIPKQLLELETAKGMAYHHKSDILKRVMYYSFSEKSMENLVAVPVDRVKEIINLNKKGVKVDALVEESTDAIATLEFSDSLESSDLDRFSKKKPKGKRKGFKPHNKRHKKKPNQ